MRRMLRITTTTKTTIRIRITIRITARVRVRSSIFRTTTTQPQRQWVGKISTQQTFMGHHKTKATRIRRSNKVPIVTFLSQIIWGPKVTNSSLHKTTSKTTITTENSNTIIITTSKTRQDINTTRTTSKTTKITTNLTTKTNTTTQLRISNSLPTTITTTTTTINRATASSNLNQKSSLIMRPLRQEVAEMP